MVALLVLLLGGLLSAIGIAILWMCCRAGDRPAVGARPVGHHEVIMSKEVISEAEEVISEAEED